VLYGLTQDQLSCTVFPLGDMVKSDVREKARSLGLPVADKAESREICFVTDDNYRRFLREKLADTDPARQPGPLVDERGVQVGQHKGYADFTVGQRRGINLALGRPYYVKQIDPSTGAVHIAPDADLFEARARVDQVNWVSIAEPAGPVMARVKIRYLHPGAEAEVTPCGEGRVEIRFKEPQRALTPGQSAVFYDGDRVLGGGLVS
jgi:tRNA-specific 2-thiouridylase